VRPALVRVGVPPPGVEPSTGAARDIYRPLTDCIDYRTVWVLWAVSTLAGLTMLAIALVSATNRFLHRTAA
jgi:hypothetical protein